MELLHKDKKQYFINTVVDICHYFGWSDITPEVIEENITDDYLQVTCYSGKYSMLTVGFWATGKWEYKDTDESGNEIIRSDRTYGCMYPEEYPDYSISVFAIHRYNYDKYRPSSADFIIYITPENKNSVETWDALEEMRRCVKNPFHGYRELVDYKNTGNIYTPYIKAYLKKVVKSQIKRKINDLKFDIQTLKTRFLIRKYKRHIHGWYVDKNIMPDKIINVTLIESSFERPYDAYILHKKLENSLSEDCGISCRICYVKDDSEPYKRGRIGGVSWDEIPSETQTWVDLNDN